MTILEEISVGAGSSGSSTKRGDEFRDSVAQLLSLCPQFTNVKVETRVGHQDVDIYYEESTSTQVRRVACECKNYAEPLTRADLEAIWCKYDPLRRGPNILIDAIRVFAPLPLRPNAGEYAKQAGLVFTTKNDLELGVIDFRNYLRSLQTEYERSLSLVYVHQTLEDGQDLESVVEDWMNGPSDRPIALLAGYGMGKTSFAEHLSAKLAKARLAGGSGRIPILIRLSSIASQQSIEGLLGAMFSAANVVPNYYFGLFAELNARGRLLLIYDGFDEMKHAMSWPDFLYNFEQLHSLVLPGARILLLGRPSVWTSDEEETMVLRGVGQTGAHDHEIPGAPEYIVHRIREFTIDEALQFIERYIDVHAPLRAAIRAHGVGKDVVTSRLGQVRRSDELLELIKRPVQAKMVADLVMDGVVRWEAMNRFQLYDVFIKRIVLREMEKDVRRPLNHEYRLTFLQAVAGWLWTRARTTSFRASELPTGLLGDLPRNTGINVESYKRELLTGGFLERKTGDTYYFPHRSFVEFLVARQMCLGECTPEFLSDAVESLNPEIVDFIREYGHAEKIAAWSEQLELLGSPPSMLFLNLLSERMEVAAIPLMIEGEKGVSARQVLLKHVRQKTTGVSLEAQFNFLVDLSDVAEEAGQAMCLILLLEIAESSAGEQQSSHLDRIVAMIIGKSLDELHELVTTNAAHMLITIGLALESIYLRSLFHSISAEHVSQTVLLHFNTFKLRSFLQALLEGHVSASPGVSMLRRLPVASIEKWNADLSLTKRGRVLVQFLDRFPNYADLLPKVRVRPKPLRRGRG